MSVADERVFEDQDGHVHELLAVWKTCIHCAQWELRFGCSCGYVRLFHPPEPVTCTAKVLD